MSASERLAALVEAYGWPPEGLREAMPEIVAVVRGQEMLCDFADQWLAHPDRDEALAQIGDAIKERRFILAALDAKLDS